MFQIIDIKLSGPICKCKTKDLSWSIGNDGIRIFCKKCEVSLSIPRKSLCATITLDEEYLDQKTKIIS